MIYRAHRTILAAMATRLRPRQVLVGVIVIALIVLFLIVRPSLELLFVIFALVLVVAMFATALGLNWRRE